MGKYQAYPEYKDSEVDWVGYIPLDWQVTRLKYVASIFGRIGFRGYTVNDIVGEGEGAIVLSPSNIVGDKFTLAKTSFLSWQKYYESPEIMVEKNDVLLVKTGSTYGKSTIVTDVDSPMTINPQMALIKNTTIDSRFLAYLFNSSLIKAKIDVNNTGSGMPTMTQENINNFPIPRPNSKLDTQIANFLDHETAKIDTLIEKQQQLIKLLKEKRQAVISHAVTKGFNPHAPMKDSGVEWLGEVPEHWVTKSYRYACKIYRGKFGHRPRNDPAFYDGDYPFIQTGDVARAGKMITSYSQTLNEKGKEVSQLFPAGTLMMAIAANIGDTAILGFKAYAPDSVVGFKPYADLDIEFLRYSFMAALPALEQTSTQSTQANLNVDRIGAVKAVFPAYDEQREIVQYLDGLLNQYDSIEKRCKEAIALMQERRTALISAAVTGKIDVRNWKAAKPQDQALEQTA
ncbi:restriction endonuclease subunit S [Vibrio parahaemolyticus]|nr:MULTISPECIES: restriction endonuclease subunit S [Vibrio]ELA9892391.1 restriction endonuclease subunit S [Vibrio parahaemolyticus]USD73587.1 restriction endonuclease subunit S [Vibrio sp. SCSIO 43009]